jgi:hypothetical protein
MRKTTPSPTLTSPQPGERQGTSLLVRCWLEPHADAAEDPVLRGYVRNLRTGEESYIKNADSVARQILRSLAGANAAGDERAAEGAR